MTSGLCVHVNKSSFTKVENSNKQSLHLKENIPYNLPQPVLMSVQLQETQWLSHVHVPSLGNYTDPSVCVNRFLKIILKKNSNLITGMRINLQDVSWKCAKMDKNMSNLQKWTEWNFLEIMKFPKILMPVINSVSISRKYELKFGAGLQELKHWSIQLYCFFCMIVKCLLVTQTHLCK